MKLHRDPPGDRTLAKPLPGPWHTDGDVIWASPAGPGIACTRVPIMTCPRCGEGAQLMPLMPSGGTLAPCEDKNQAAAHAQLIVAAPLMLATLEALEHRLAAIGAHPDWLAEIRAAIEAAR